MHKFITRGFLRTFIVLWTPVHVYNPVDLVKVYSPVDSFEHVYGPVDLFVFKSL